jgi:hypothetical protein
MGRGNKDEIFYPGQCNRKKEGAAAKGWLEFHSGRHLLIENRDVGESARLPDGLGGRAVANGAMRAAASLDRLSCPIGAHSLRRAYPQGQHCHEDLNEDLQANKHVKALQYQELISSLVTTNYSTRRSWGKQSRQVLPCR